MKKILVINPGSTSTKLAVYHDEKVVWGDNGQHPPHDLSAYKHCNEQYAYRLEHVMESLCEAGIPLKFDAIIARGGLMRPTPGGVYSINEKMKHDLFHSPHEHPCNLGAPIAEDIARRCGCPAYVADPEAVDEMEPRAHICGIPGMRRVSIFHALNGRALSRRYAKSVGKKYEDLNFIVAHLGGGISVAAHKRGRVVDTNNALNGEGPFSPERAGTVPAQQLVELCFSGKYTKQEITKLICGKGGLMAHLGTNDMKLISQRAAAGEEPYKGVLDAMLYTVAKQVGAMYVTLLGQCDAIIITGGIARSEYCTNELKRQIEYLAPIVVVPGEDEMGSLALNALAALQGTLPLQEYNPAEDEV